MKSSRLPEEIPLWNWEWNLVTPWANGATKSLAVDKFVYDSQLPQAAEAASHLAQLGIDAHSKTSTTLVDFTEIL